MSFSPHLIPMIVFPALVLFAAVRDATSFTIPNWISLAAIGLFFPAALLVGTPPPGLGLALGAGLLVLLAGMALFAFGWIGGGDAKLMAACALWMGWPATLNFLFFTSAAGGVLALALLAGRNSSAFLPRQAPAWLIRLLTPKADVPYGVAIAAGALAAFPASLLMRVPG